MIRQFTLLFCAAIVGSPVTAAEKSPTAVYLSSRSASDVVACLSDRISEFQSPQVRPSEGGRTRIVTMNMHVTMIDLTIIPGAETRIEVRRKSSKKLRSIIENCRGSDGAVSR